MSAQPTYRFRYANMTLGNHLENMRFRAKKLRREAEVLLVRAAAIENEADALSNDLQAVTDTEDAPDA